MEKSKSYTTFRNYNTEDIVYTFLSIGHKKILKAIEFSLAGEFLEHPVFNLGFGNYSTSKDAIADNIVSNNGDAFAVFNTVLHTAKSFLKNNPEVIIMIRGSDSTDSFSDTCMTTCTRRCTTECKRKHKRINIYGQYIEKNLSHLQWEYNFNGSFLHEFEEFMLENYRTGAEYLSLFITKK